MQTRTRNKYQEYSPSDLEINKTNEERLGKFMFGVFFPIFCITIQLPLALSWGIDIYEWTFFLVISILFFIFSRKVIFQKKKPYTFSFDPDSFWYLDDNIKQHQKYFQNKQRNIETEKFLNNYNCKEQLLYYTFYLSVAIVPVILIGLFLLDSLGYKDPILFSYLFLVIWVFSMLFIRKKVELKKTYSFDSRHFFFLWLWEGKYEIKTNRDTYFILEKM